MKCILIILNDSYRVNVPYCNSKNTLDRNAGNIPILAYISYRSKFNAPNVSNIYREKKKREDFAILQSSDFC